MDRTRPDGPENGPDKGLDKGPDAAGESAMVGKPAVRPARRIRVKHVTSSKEHIERSARDAEARGALKRRRVDAPATDAPAIDPSAIDASASDAAGAYSQEQYEAAYAEAQRTIEDQLATTRQHHGATRFLGIVAAVALTGLGTIWSLNGKFAEELYSRPYAEKIAEAFDNDTNFGVFDLNLDIRNLRDAHIARLDETPDVVLLGASHWQEADVGLVTDRTMYNAHIHRDYYEDPLAMIEMFERHDRLPDTMILTIRDNQFTPVADRTDFLWLPGIPYYRRMAKRLGVEQHHPIETAPVDTWRNRLSLDILATNVRRWLEAETLPGPTDETKAEARDILLPGGSIVWSREHDDLFTQERMMHEALTFAESKKLNPPQIDPKGVEHIDTLLHHLNDRGVRVYLAHPPFNPVYWDAVQGTPYMEGLRKVEALVQGWADEFGWDIVGGFDPEPLGCTADQYIDAEHANRDCLRAVFDQFMALDRAKEGLPPLDSDTPAPMPFDPSYVAPGSEALVAAAPVATPAPALVQAAAAAPSWVPATVSSASLERVVARVPAGTGSATNLSDAEARALLSREAMRGLID